MKKDKQEEFPSEKFINRLKEIEELKKKYNIRADIKLTLTISFPTSSNVGNCDLFISV